MSLTAPRAALGLSYRLALVIDGLCRAVGVRSAEDRSIPAVVLNYLAWVRLRRLAVRFAALMAAVRADRLAAARPAHTGELLIRFRACGRRRCRSACRAGSAGCSDWCRRRRPIPGRWSIGSPTRGSKRCSRPRRKPAVSCARYAGCWRSRRPRPCGRHRASRPRPLSPPRPAASAPPASDFCPSRDPACRSRRARPAFDRVWRPGLTRRSPGSRRPKPARRWHAYNVPV